MTACPIEYHLEAGISGEVRKERPLIAALFAVALGEHHAVIRPNLPAPA